MTLTQYIILILGALLSLSRPYWLIQPLPSRLEVAPVDNSIAPRTTTLRIKYNEKLMEATKLFKGEIYGAESVYVDKSSRTLYVIDRYGTVFVSGPADSHNSNSPPPPLKRVTYVGPGRPLGYHIHPHSKHLIICDSLKGLLQLDTTSTQNFTLTVLANHETNDGSPITYANDLDISESTGLIYFSDSTAIPPALNRQGFYDTMQSYLLTALQGRATGRLLVHNPKNKSTTTLVSGIWFANGVALAEDDSYVLVAETVSMRLRKHWLKGPRAGLTEILIDSLPGYPDGLCRSSDGEYFWVALIIPESGLQRAVAWGGLPARWLMSWAIQIIQPVVKQWGVVLKISGDTGEIVDVLMDSKGSVISGVSGVMEVDNSTLWMGHLSEDYISFYKLT